MLSVLARAIASSEAIVQAKANDVELITKSRIEGRRGRSRYSQRDGRHPDRISAQIDKLIFDLCTPMLVEQPFDPA
jgi:hypothetical protein